LTDLAAGTGYLQCPKLLVIPVQLKCCSRVAISFDLVSYTTETKSKAYPNASAYFRVGGASDSHNETERNGNFKTEQFIIKNKNIKQERERKFISFINCFHCSLTT